MAKVRIYELSKELGISNKELMTLLEKEFDIEVKSHMNVVDEEDANLIKELLKVKDDGDEDLEEDEPKKVKEKKKTKAPKKKEEKKEPVKKAKEKVEKEEKPKKTKKESLKDKEDKVIEIGKFISVKEFADKINKPSSEVIKALMFSGIMAGINQEINFEAAKKAADKLEVEIVKEADKEAGLDENKLEDELDVNLVKRPPIVTVMGHVDHGKTSLLDAIREEKVTESEAGGITQHIGAYTVEINGEKVTFLDTPGHEAFTAMRSRGAQITDVVILVVAADDGIMPQTREAISHCKAAGVPIVVAINKVDKPAANIERVMQELTEYGLLAEEWGGDTICVPVSAIERTGIDSLLEMVVLTAEIEELKADPNRRSQGTVIESELDKGRGPVATLLVQKGTLNIGDSIQVGSTYGRIRAMFDDKGKTIKTAGPSIPVEVLGLSEVPEAGD